ncbi:hypothetical protein EB061_00045 [bacterium]|nr:hypothetical protein [bacterium]
MNGNTKRNHAFKDSFTSHIRVDKVWIAFFSIWVVLLTGALDFWIQSPGLKQWWRVNTMLDVRRQEIDKVEEKTVLLQQVLRELQENPIAQEREVRKILGYLGEQEVVFEFSGS